MAIDGFIGQFTDPDPGETEEWLQSLRSVVDGKGSHRAGYLLAQLEQEARRVHVGAADSLSTPYVNTIPPRDEPPYPGDLALERRLRALARWNAAAMVVNANHQADGIGGHLASYASAAALYEVGFNHFFRGRTDDQVGDHVYVQGHASPGIYARAFLEGRLSEHDLDGFRRELSADGLPSYPHPRLRSDFWEFPTVSMGLGPINSIYQARFNRYLAHRGIDDTEDSRVWCFLGDGECDEPETLGAIGLAGREQLDNLVWVVNCNLQRLDGPVRGNGKIIQELESAFRGAGWNVVKVVWGSAWDPLIAADVDGVLVDRMGTTVDGAYQRYLVEPGSVIREDFFGPDPRLAGLVDHLSDADLEALPRGGHDPVKIHAAYAAAIAHRGEPTVVLAKTVKGWALGSAVEGRNATHQIKKLNSEELVALRDRLHLEDVVSTEALAGDHVPYVRPEPGSPEARYLSEHRSRLGGSVPSRSTKVRVPLSLPSPDVFAELDDGSGALAVSTTMAMTRLVRGLARSDGFGRRVVPVIPDEARTFGMDSLFRELGIYAPNGQQYRPVDAELLLSYSESVDGQILQEGITEAGAMASFIAAGTAYATRGVPMVPFYAFYSMFGFQRVGDLAWAAADAQARGFLLGGTAGRTTLLGEGLQHQDGHSLLLASVIPTCRAYDPAFAYELGAVVRQGLEVMYGGSAGAGEAIGGEPVFFYLTLYNETYRMPPRPEGLTDDAVLTGLYRWSEAPDGVEPRVTVLFSGSAHGAARRAQELLAERYGVGAELWSAPGYKRLREDALAVERFNRLHPELPPRAAPVTELLAGAPGPIVAVSDYIRAVPDQIARFVPPMAVRDARGRRTGRVRPRPFVSLGTDGFGRSDTREALRRFFEVDAEHVVVAALAALADVGVVERSVVARAITEEAIATDEPPPWNR
ncbi:MAG: pyruvate dehydrogenase (acetyl-transferring), homodimeric type [Actinomycetota bacterium]|nr:pyruvate dehydrogenase (acetyl-transferring), homodimeric type [Actinomycetota bacterium]